MQTAFDFEINWNEPEELDTKANRKAKEIAECGKPIVKIRASTGGIVVYPMYCKHWRECEGCRQRRINLEEKRLSQFVGQAKMLEVSVDEEKSITEKYGKDKIRRIPVGEDKTIFVIDTDDDIGELITMEDVKQIAEYSIPEETGRRVSGSLGSVSATASGNDEDLTIDAFDPKVEVEVTEMRIDLQGNAITFKDLERMAHEECSVTESPATLEELQAAVINLEDTVQRICERENIPFSVYNRTKEVLRLSQVKWTWVYFERKKPVLA